MFLLLYCMFVSCIVFIVYFVVVLCIAIYKLCNQVVECSIRVFLPFQVFYMLYNRMLHNLCIIRMPLFLIIP